MRAALAMFPYGKSAGRAQHCLHELAYLRRFMGDCGQRAASVAEQALVLVSLNGYWRAERLKNSTAELRPPRPDGVRFA